MSGHDDLDEREVRERWTELGVRVDIPHPARVYDYMLGGKDLDIGTGLPTSPTTHEVAREGGLRARVAYVDNDPVVFRLAQAPPAG